MKKNKIPQTPAELEAHLQEQLQFLQVSAESFDNGFNSEAKRLAVNLRVLLHDTKKSQSLLGLLGIKERNYISTVIPHDSGNISTHGGLIMIAMSGSEACYVAMLDDMPIVRELVFEEWWNEIVFMDFKRDSLSRKELVLTIANQDGGTHVDPALEERYARLSRMNSMGWVISNGKVQKPIPMPERAAIRQITHEVLRTIVPGYSKKPSHKADVILGGAMLHQSAPSHIQDSTIVKKVGRNEPCPCGSDRKYKKCHGC